MRSKTFWDKKTFSKFKIRIYIDGSVMIHKDNNKWNSSIFFTKEQWKLFKNNLSELEVLE